MRLRSDHTTKDWFNFVRKLCSEILENGSEKLGGTGKAVEIDESKFGKIKYMYYRGKKLEGVLSYLGYREGKQLKSFSEL